MDKFIFNILIADDSEDDRFLLRTAIRLVPGLNVVAEVANGTQVIAYLHGLGQFGNRKEFPLPDLLLLDLRMPFKDGFEVLEWLQAQQIPKFLVIVLTDSLQPGHVKRALDLGADHYLIKGRSCEDRYAMARGFEKHLLRTIARHPLPVAAALPN